MPGGIRATVEFTTTGVCPLSKASADANTTIGCVRRSVSVSDTAQCVIDFVMDCEYEFDADVEHLFDHGTMHRYRLTHTAKDSCPCACLGTFGCSVEHYTAHNGTLTLVFYTTGYEQLQTVVGALRDRFPGLNIKRFIRQPPDESSSDGVLVDRSRLTARQREVLETSYEMGYFDRPRRANATEIAAALDISPSTFREHLATAQSKLFEELL